MTHLKDHSYVSISIEHTNHDRAPSFHDDDEFESRPVKHTISFDKIPPLDEWHYASCMMGGIYSEVDNRLHDEIDIMSRVRYIPGLERYIHDLLNRLCSGPNQIQNIADEMKQ